MTRTPALRSWIGRLAVVCAVLTAGVLVQAQPAAAASRLANGNRLLAGQCLSAPGNGQAKPAKFCVGRYYDINLYYNGRICWTWQAAGHISGPSAFVRVASNGNVEFYQYSGGRRLWQSGTTSFPGADLVVGSHSTYLKAVLAVDTGSAFFTFKSCR